VAVVRGSAVNHDGMSSGLTVPNGRSQAATIGLALANANVSAGDVSYVEAHGTGTAIGDPIEVEALAATYGRAHSLEAPLLVGTAKTNIAHLEAGAGVAGLLKVVLALAHERIPRHLHCADKSPHVAWASLPISITTEAHPWPRGPRPRLAGVS